MRRWTSFAVQTKWERLRQLRTAAEIGAPATEHLRQGSIVAFRLPSRERSVTLLCQGIPFARGELIDIDGSLGVRVTRLTHADVPA